MAIEITCDDCGAEFRVGDDRAGTRVRCKECGSAITVPDEDADTYDAYEERRSRPKKGKKKSGGPPVVPLIAGGAAAVVAFAVVFFIMTGKNNNNAPPAPPAPPFQNNQIAQNNPPPPVPAPGDNQNANNTQQVNPANAAGNTNTAAGNNVAQTGNNNAPITTDAPAIPVAVASNNQKPKTDINPAPMANKPSGFQGFGREEETAEGNAGDNKAPDRNLGSEPPPAGWEVTVDAPEAELPAISDKQISIRFPANTGIEDVLVPYNPSVFVAVGNNESERNVREIWNLATNKKVGSITGGRLNGRSVADLSPDGAYFAASQGNEGNKGVGVWSTKSGKLVAECETTEAGFGLKHLMFAGNKRLLGMTSKHEIRTWKLPSGEVDQDFNIGTEADSYKEFAASPGGKFVAIIAEKNTLSFFNLETGDHAGDIPLKLGNGFFAVKTHGMAFSRDGKRFAGVFHCFSVPKAQLYVINVATGAVEKRFELDEVKSDHDLKNHGPALDWFPDNERLLWSGHHVLDIVSGGPLWTAPHEDNSSAGPRRILNDSKILVTIGDRREGMLRSAPIPKQEIDEAAKVVASGGEATQAGMPSLAKATTAGAAALNLALPADWSMKSDPAPAPKTLKVAIATDPERGHIGGAYLTRPDIGLAVVWSSTDHVHGGLMRVGGNFRGNAPTLLDLIDLESGKAVTSIPLNHKALVRNINGEGTVIALVPPDHNNDRLDLFTLPDGKPYISWKPYVNENPFKNPTEVLVLDAEHVVTRNFGGVCIGWKLPACQATFRTEHAQLGDVSPTGKYFTLEHLSRGDDPSKVVFVETASGAAVGELPALGSDAATGFSPDGTKVAVWSTDGVSHRVVIADVATGKVSQDSLIAGGGPSVIWCNDKQLLLGHAALYDMDREAVVWGYQLQTGNTGGLPITAPASSLCWYIGRSAFNDPSAVLTGLKLPEQAVQQRIEQAQQVDQTILKSGALVSLAINITAPQSRPNLATEVATAFQQELQKKGYQIAAGAPFTISVSTQQMATGDKMEFRQIFGGGGGTTTVNIQKVDCNIDLLQNGQSVWKSTRSASNSAFGIVRNGDEPIEQYINRMMWESVHGQLTKFPFPAKVFRKDGPLGLGESQFIPGGTKASARR